MYNTEKLFENLVLFSEMDSTPKINTKVVKEEDETILNLSVELPTDKTDIEPEDVKVNVGVMNVDAEGSEDEEENKEDVEVPEDEDPIDVTPEGEESIEPTDDDEKPVEDEEANESLKLEKKCKDDDCEKVEEAIDTAKLDKAINKHFDNTVKSWDLNDDDANKVIVKFKDGSENEFSLDTFEIEESTEVDDAKKRILARANKVTESLLKLDTKSLNNLITSFVKDNYRNIDKVVINKAVLENNTLTLSGKIHDANGLTENIILKNKGFNATKLENKKFQMDFADVNKTFGAMRESVNKPFMFTCKLQEGLLTFDELAASFKTRIDENKIAKVSGTYTLTECMVKPEKDKKEVECVTENADQVKKFNEIADKIKAAKTANDLSECKDLMDDSNVGDTLLSALQMIWDDVNSRMKG